MGCSCNFKPYPVSICSHCKQEITVAIKHEKNARLKPEFSLSVQGYCRNIEVQCDGQEKDLLCVDVTSF